MSKRSEEAALKAYPKEVGKMYSTAFGTFEFDRNAAERKGFQEGYEQAEKDLALTWEDMVLLRILFDATDAQQAMGALKVQPMTKEYYDFILHEFNEQRKK